MFCAITCKKCASSTVNMEIFHIMVSVRSSVCPDANLGEVLAGWNRIAGLHQVHHAPKACVFHH